MPGKDAFAWEQITMTRDDIIRMALEAGASVVPTMMDIERFAALVAAHEREACAKVCHEWNTAMTDKLAAAIRARGNA